VFFHGRGQKKGGLEKLRGRERLAKAKDIPGNIEEQGRKERRTIHFGK